MGEWSGRLGERKGGRERAELAGTAGWGWWLKAEETRGGGGGVRVGFLAWHRGIDTPVGAQRHQRLRRPTSLHLDDRTKPLFPILHFLFPPSGRTFTPRIGYANHRRDPTPRTSFHRSNISFDLVASSSIDDEDTWTDILGYSVNCSVSCRCNSGERNTSVRNTNARTGDENWYAAGNGLKRTPH